MFALPGKEREAFFDLLDEYFSQRPHLLQNYQRPSKEPVSSAPVGLKKPAPPPPPRQHQRQVNSSLGSTRTTNTNGIESDLQEMHVSPMHKDIRKPEGLTTTKVRIFCSFTHVDSCYVVTVDRKTGYVLQECSVYFSATKHDKSFPKTQAGGTQRLLYILSHHNDDHVSIPPGTATASIGNST